MWKKFSVQVFTLVFLLTFQGYAQTWDVTYAPYGRNINDATILPDGKMVLVGGNRSNDAIWSTFTSTSFGLSWNIDLDLIQPWSKACSFYNDQKGIAVGEQGSIKRTTDAGANWTNIPSQTNKTLNDVFFVNSTSGFAVGGIHDAADTSQVILKSIDGGQSWSLLSDKSGSPLRSVYFTDENRGVAVGDNGEILKTIDAGQNWTTITPPVVHSFNKVWFLNGSVGFIVGGKSVNDSIRTVLKTVDGGNSWNIMLNESGGWLRDVHFIDQNTGYVVGDVATVLKTIDGGHNWSSVTLPGLTGFERFNTVEFLSADLGLVAGDHGIVYIFHTIPVPEV